MSDFSNSLQTAVSGMRAQSTRLRHVSENIANTDTPGYRRKVMNFEQVTKDGAKTGEVRSAGISLDRTELARIFDPAHPMSNEDGYYDGSNVDLVVEIADAREAQRSYEANLKMFEQTRKMSSKLLELLRK
ncbi:flagellar basal body rod protein FlgC [Cognatishimia sp. MH4019]|uniref:flagellar basal body rod protein FlgC n=1 Tax=Cognatishimia sp. MH4019 TaxID=2854030 RepID=UPI001CD72404|nr:flagellar basal body rod protein FlgC [Cognatishimia sp. MH4019]